MYKWYRLAEVCYAYLADVPPREDHHTWGSAFHLSRWFCRGWTLQELIAPVSVEFLSQDWATIGSKRDLVDLIESITKIDHEALMHWVPLDRFSAAQRLSWAASRQTTRVEDRAYSLLGLFDINMPTLYGEGNYAFRRLQELIMQRTPDQSLFAWGDHYPSSQLSQDTGVPNTHKARIARLRTWGNQRSLFCTSPDNFKGCEGVRTTRRDIGKLLSSNGHKISYTHTPYGISTQLLMVPLTRDLLLRAISHFSEDFQLDTSDLPRGYQLYLAILQCELGERQGYCLGRVCYLTPSEESDINSVYPACVRVATQQGKLLGWADLFLLSPSTIEHRHPQIELKTVYIPHPDRTALSASWSLRGQPYTVIKLVLLRETRHALRSRGYLANLHAPEPDRPSTHCLTLSKDDHTITIEFKHTLNHGGYKFTIEAEVKMSGSCVQLDSAQDSDQAERHNVSWSDYRTWDTELCLQRVRFSAAGAGMLTVDLGLDFRGQGYYILRVEVLSDAPPASPVVEQAVDQVEEEERTEKNSQSGAMNTEDAIPGDPEEAGGDETALSAEDRDVVARSNNVEGGDGDGRSA